MGLSIENDMLHTLLFADDQMLVTGFWGSEQRNIKELAMSVGNEDPSNLDIGVGDRTRQSVKISSSDAFRKYITNTIDQLKKSFQLNSSLWRNKLLKTKHRIYNKDK